MDKYEIIQKLNILSFNLKVELERMACILASAEAIKEQLINEKSDCKEFTHENHK